MALRTTRWGFHTVRDGIDPGDYRFLLWFIGVVYIYGRISDPGMGSYIPRVALPLRTPGWSLHTVRGGIDPGGHRCRPRIIGTVDVQEDFGSLSSPGAAGSTNTFLLFREPSFN